MITTMLFYTVFALAFGGITRQIGDISFLEFLAPGLIMMSMVQNAFANSSSSIMIAKVQGNITDTLLPPLSSFELYIGFTAGSMVRGLIVGMATALAMSLFAPMHIDSWFIIISYAISGTILLGSLGLAAGIWAEKFDHIGAVTNFIVTPLTFLSGTFYSIQQLPEFWHGLALYNPFFYMIDGFRAGFIGQSDGDPILGLVILAALNVILAFLTFKMLATGYKIKS